MENDDKTNLAMFDQVTRIEPQLRDTMTAIRKTAKQSIDLCYITWASTVDNVHEESQPWYDAWLHELDEERKFNEKLSNVLQILSTNGVAMRCVLKATEDNKTAALEAVFAYLNDLELDETTAVAVTTYVDYLKALVASRRENYAGKRRARGPQQVTAEVYKIVEPIFLANQTPETQVCKKQAVSLQQEQSRLAAEFQTARESLGLLVAQMDGTAEKLDHANLAIAELMRTKIKSISSNKNSLLTGISRSAVDTCTAVIILSRRIVAIKDHHPTMRDVAF